MISWLEHKVVDKDNMSLRLGGNTYSKPMCEWMTRRAQRMESVTGLREPAAKGATVRGIRPADTILMIISQSHLYYRVQKYLV